MRVVLASTYIPFLQGGGTMIVDSLEYQMKQRGFEVDTVRIPFHPEWPRIPQQMLALRNLDMVQSAAGEVDLLVTVRYPSYCMDHPNKVSWFLHHHRGAYDLWGTPFQDIPSTPEGQRFRQTLIDSDTRYLNECQRIFTISKRVGQRIKQFNGIDVTGVRYPPLPNSDRYYTGDFGNYVVFPSRLTPLKRQELAIRAMQHVRSDVRLVLIGSPDVPAYLEELQQLACELGVEQRVEFKGWISLEEKIDLIAHSAGVVFTPQDEDYGYVTLEAFYSGKAVITCTDSGGPTEFIESGVNGLTIEPSATSLAEAIEKIASDRAYARKMGQAAYDMLPQFRLTWDYVIEGLLG